MKILRKQIVVEFDLESLKTKELIMIKKQINRIIVTKNKFKIEDVTSNKYLITCLRRADILYLDQLIDMSTTDILRILGVGKKGLTEIRDLIDNLKFGK